MNMLFAIEFSPVLSVVLSVLLLSSAIGLYAYVRIGRSEV